MTKSELIETLATRTNITKTKADLIVTSIFDAMIGAMKKGEGIEIRGFGSFSIRKYSSYQGRNPRTGEPVHVSSKQLPFFKVGKELKKMVNSGSKPNKS